MSKERELIQRVLTSELWSVQAELQAEIKELLAQPEQVTIGWMYDYISPTSVKHTTAIFDEYPSEDWMINIRPLYTSPQKREPLSKEAIRAIVNQLPTEVDLDTGIEFCRIIEKAHGIGVDDE